MYFVIAISCFAIILSWLDAKKRLKDGLKYAFYLLIIISAIRYDYGTDYINYKNGFDYYANISNIKTAITQQYNMEIGWIILCKIFKPLGFYWLIAFISIIINYAYYKTIARYVQRDYYALAICIYLFYPDLFLLGQSMLRQELAISMFLLAFPYIEKRKILRPIILLLIAISFHTSALILFPFIGLGYVKWHWKKAVAAILLISFFLFMISSKILTSIFTQLTQFEAFAKYIENYGAWDSTSEFGLGFILKTIPFFVAIYYIYTTNSSQNISLIFLSCISILVLPFVQIIGLLDRISYYFSCFYVASLPIIYTYIKRRLVRIALLFLLFLMMFASYYNFLHSESYAEKYTTYQTIFNIL